MSLRSLLALACALGVLVPLSAHAATIQEAHIKVQVQGAVRRPGIYSLLAGARLVELVALAGGPRPDADLVDLNLTRVLMDGEQCQVLTKQQAQVAAAPAEDTPGGEGQGKRGRGKGHGKRKRGKAGDRKPRVHPGSKGGHRKPRVRKGAGAHVRINHAGMAELEQLPGVGESLAKAILAQRQRQGSFHAIDDLREVPGLGERRLARMRPCLVLD